MDVQNVLLSQHFDKVEELSVRLWKSTAEVNFWGPLAQWLSEELIERKIESKQEGTQILIQFGGYILNVLVI